ncbi:hypothetical protein [Lysobacter sp. CFH 32150]|uniref:hypothetical protein n=1 Tax=Lysobacter sp. CFH 32150 TaxID=2927128 RepID=UPI001FA78C31|nr:hypothetical protein [Lysobacter sp. CFH 32150]MCI4567545.1 hypothetical protein [Lysobacter sp. CFH 32150]
MTILSRWLAPAVLAAGLGFGAMAPAPAQAQDDTLTRVLVDIADVVLRGGVPYYRYGDYGYDDRLIVQRDRYGRLVYYRMVPRYQSDYRAGPPYGNAYGYWNNGPGNRKVKCNKHGKCKVTYYDPRYDRRDYYDRYYDDRYSRYDRNDRYWDGRRWRDRDDDDDDD